MYQLSNVVFVKILLVPTSIEDVEEQIKTFRGVSKHFRNLVDQVFVEVMYFAWGRHLRDPETFRCYSLGGRSFDEQALLEFSSWNAYKTEFKPFVCWYNSYDTPAFHEQLPEFDWIPTPMMDDDYEEKWRLGKVQRKRIKL